MTIEVEIRAGGGPKEMARRKGSVCQHFNSYVHVVSSTIEKIATAYCMYRGHYFEYTTDEGREAAVAGLTGMTEAHAQKLGLRHYPVRAEAETATAEGEGGN